MNAILPPGYIPGGSDFLFRCTVGVSIARPFVLYRGAVTDDQWSPLHILSIDLVGRGGGLPRPYGARNDGGGTVARWAGRRGRRPLHALPMLPVGNAFMRSVRLRIATGASALAMTAKDSRAVYGTDKSVPYVLPSPSALRAAASPKGRGYTLPRWGSCRRRRLRGRRSLQFAVYFL